MIQEILNKELMENFPKEIQNEDRAKQIIAEWNQEIQLK